MEVRIQSIHFDASEQLQAFVQKKAVKLEKYYDDIKKVEVSLKVVKPETAENKEAGIKVGDVIEEVNGKSVKGLSTIEVTSLIKKKDTEKARIKIIRNGEALTFDVEKRNVIIDSVESKLLILQIILTNNLEAIYKNLRKVIFPGL